ncbi:MAG: hypothetical protein IJN39_00445, partial [Clostridia bacterium]|nr:hypothetical protein [Clostridia bacterium]
MKRVISLIICIAITLSMMALPLSVQAENGTVFSSEGLNGAVYSAVLNGTNDYVIWKASENGEKNVSVRLKAGSSVVVTPTISGVAGESVEITATENGMYNAGKYTFTAGDTLKFSTKSSAVIEEIVDFKTETVFNKTEAVITKSWNQTSSSWIDYDGTKAWYNGSAYWEFTGLSGDNEIFYYVPEKAVGSNLWNTLVTLVKVNSDSTEEVITSVEMKVGPETSGWISLFSADLNETDTYRVKVEKGSGDISGVSDASRLCGMKIVSGEKLIAESGSWTIPENTGMCNAHLYVSSGTSADVQIIASGETKVIDINATNSGYYELGSCDFTGGGSISVTADGSSKIRMLKVVPTDVLYLDTTTADEIKDLSKSSVPGFNSAPGYYGNGSASWTIPSTVSGPAEIYYYIPDLSDGTCACSAIITYTGEDGTTVERIFNGKDIKAGWHKLGIFDLSGNGTETLKAARYTAESYSTSIRVYGFKIVEVPDAYRNYIFTPESFGATGDWS